MAKLNAGVSCVGPFELDRVGAKLFCLPSADVTDFAVAVVVPALSGDRVGDGFTEFVGRG